MRAVGLFSGGLDSILAVKLMQEQGIEVIGVAFTSPFFVNSEEKKGWLRDVAEKEGFELRFMELRDDYFDMVKKPKHGHGKNMNPCIDCHAFMLRKAKELMDSEGAGFIFTGEVLDERPMSQRKKALGVVEEEAGLKGKLLRPLSAKLLEETEAEKKGLVDREKLLDIKGRGRKRQIELARKLGVKDYETPAGGCILTNKEYSEKLKDLFRNNKDIKKEDVVLLKTGRHFRVGDTKIIVGKDEKDNEKLERTKHDLILEAKDFVGPVTIVKGRVDDKIIEIAASLTARYCDADQRKVKIIYGKKAFDKDIIVKNMDDAKIEKIRI
ncbi:DUF814 domain-containing protein [Candidatus Woesearchaeota archaeon]|nr:DUF814 domain-containing protein [Candidatus Woesearchaeota archaeon]